ncbi:MAG: asparagine synthase (glutamine-hydrolyzing), partial [bacterium]|nr:asparagine synthase (glutamine-hydrolyzing) [bacterium]
MCGIVGTWNIDGKPLEKRELDMFTDSLAHRGPDGRGTYIDEDAQLGLGHRRLSILDLSDTGKQPMSFASEGYWITFNGEIYNFLELREELKGLGYEFKTESDTEVVLAAYDKWREDCQYKFNGMWAMAIWDRKERTLFLSRDRFGIKPLHYYYDGRLFAFASEMKAFLHHPRIKVETDSAVLKRAIRFPAKIEGTEECLLKGIKRLRGGYCLTLKEKETPRPQRWWNTLQHLETAPFRYSKQVERFRELFFDAVNIRMRSDVPIGTALSGGLDSSAVLCTMAKIRENNKAPERQNPDWQKAFVAQHPDYNYDESQYAASVIEKINGTGIYKTIEPYEAIDEIPAIIGQLEEIYYEILVTSWEIYKTMRQTGIYVTLDGDGGDELLAGYQHHPLLAMRDTVWPVPRPIKYRNLKIAAKKMYQDESRFQTPKFSYLWKRRVYQSKPEPYPDLIADQPL